MATCLINAIRGIEYGFTQAGNRHASNSKDSLSRQDNEIEAKCVLMKERCINHPLSLIVRKKRPPILMACAQ